MRITPFLPFITCLFISLMLLNACDTLPTGHRKVPAPVERYGANNNDAATLSSGSAKVAILLPLSGGNAALGQSMLQAAQMAVFDISNSNLELMPVDTKGTTTGGQQAAQTAINNGAQIILGPIFADAVRGAKLVTASKNINMISFSTDWSLADQSTFIMGFMPFSQVDRIADYATSQRLKRFAVIAPRDKYGDIVTSRFKQRIEKNGGNIVNTINFLPNDTAIVQKLSAINPDMIDAIFMPVGGRDLENISSALTVQGMPPSSIKRLGTGLWDNPQMATLPALQSGWFAAPAPSNRKTFEKAYKSTYGQSPMRINTLAYDATALAALLSTKGYTYNNLTDSNGFIGIDGVFRFGKDRIVERGLSVLEFRNGQIAEISPAPKSF